MPYLLTADATNADITELMTTIKEDFFPELDNEDFGHQVLEINGMFPMKAHSLAHLRLLCDKCGLKIQIVIRSAD